MIGISFATQTVTLIRPGVTTDERGVEQYSYQPADRLVRQVDGCILEPGAPVESQGPDRARVDYTLYAPAELFTSWTEDPEHPGLWIPSPPLAADPDNPGLFLPPADPDYHFHVEFDGHEYEVEGEPARWRSPLGALDHVVVLLKRWL